MRLFRIAGSLSYDFRTISHFADEVKVYGEEVYRVLGIEESRMYRNQLRNLVRWTEYDSLTWMLVKIMDGMQAVEQFHQRNPQKAGPLESVLGGPSTWVGDTVIVSRNRKVLRSYDENLGMLWKELCYGKAEKLRDMENVERWLRYKLV